FEVKGTSPARYPGKSPSASVPGELPCRFCRWRVLELDVRETRGCEAAGWGGAGGLPQPAAGSERDGEAFVGDQDLAVELGARLRRGRGAVRPWPAVSEQQAAGSGLGGPMACLGGGKEVTRLVGGRRLLQCGVGDQEVRVPGEFGDDGRRPGV